MMVQVMKHPNTYIVETNPATIQFATKNTFKNFIISLLFYFFSHMLVPPLEVLSPPGACLCVVLIYYVVLVPSVCCITK